MMTEERGLRSANAKLLQDKKALERRVADLEEEIKVRCRNYMNIIERMRRGEVVERVVYERSADKVEGSGEKVRNGFGSPERIRNLWIFPVMELKLDVKIPAVPGIGKTQDKSKQKQEIGEKRTSQVVRKVEKESKEVQTDVVKEIPQKTQSQGLFQGNEQVKPQKPQLTASPKLIQPVNQVAAQPPKKIPQDNSTQTDKVVKSQDSRAAQTEQSITITVLPSQISSHQLQNQTSTKSSSIPLQPPTSSNISPQIPPTLHQNPSQLEQLKLQIAELDLQLAKHKAVHSALLNYKPSPLVQLNHFNMTRSIPTKCDLLATAKSLEMKVEVVLVKLEYFEKILGTNREDRLKPVRKEMELLLKQIQQQSEQSTSTQEQLQSLRKLLQQTSTQRDRAQHLYQSLTTQHSTTQQQLQALQLRIRQSKALLSTPRKTETERTSSRNSSNQKSVPMARHHMIMFNKPECKECAKLREQLASEREEVIGKCSLEMGAQAEKYERDVKGLREEVDGLREELAKAKAELEKGEKGEGSGRPRRQTPEFAKTSSKEHLPGSPPAVGVRQRQLSLANLNTEYIKRSFTRTKTMRKTISVQKHTLSNLSQIHQSLRQKIGNVRQKLQKLRDTDGPRGQIEQLEKIDRKLTKLGARCGVVTERISERSEDSQETETEIIEVRFESPGRSDRLRVVENRRRGGAGEQEGEGGRANRFDFRKKNTLPES